MSFFRRLLGLASSPRQSAPVNEIEEKVRQSVERGFRRFHCELLEERRVLAASPLVVGAVYIEGDGGTDAQPDQFYISYQGGSPETAVPRIVIDGNQDGSPALGDTDVYFDVRSNSAADNILGAGDAHGFEWSASSTGISAGEVIASVVDGGTRLVLDLVDFRPGDVLAFTIDVDQFFSSKPHDQVTSGIEFAGSSLEITAVDPDYTFEPDPAVSVGTFEYSFDFGSDDVADTGVLSQLPSQHNRTNDNGFNSTENRTAGALKEFSLVPRPVTISGHVGLTDSNGVCVDPLSPAYEGVSSVLITAEDSLGNRFTTTTDSNGYYEFAGLTPGSYSVTETQPGHLLDGDETVGTVDGITRGIRGSNDQFIAVVLGPGDVGINYDFCEMEPASVGGTVYHDRNDNGVLDSGENGIGGVTIELLDDTGNSVAMTLTDSQGKYLFDTLLPGTYTVHEIQPNNYLDGKDSAGLVKGQVTGSAANDLITQIVLQAGDQGVEYNFGELREAIIEGVVMTDLNDNCLLETQLGERPLENVRLQLLDEGRNVVDEVRTDSQGRYRFDGLRPGSYSVRQIQPGSVFTIGQTIGTFRVSGADGPGLASENRLSDITVFSGSHLVDYNFCEAPAATISGYVFQDGTAIALNPGESLTDAEAEQLRDGLLTGDDTRIAGVVLELRHGVTGLPITADQALPGVYANGPIRTTTDTNGYYEFSGLKQGNYAVFEIQPDGFRDHIDTEGTNLGIPVNPVDDMDPFILSTLAVGVDPANDAILRIPLNWGDHAALNNFSEIAITHSPTTPPINPPSTPPSPIPVFGPNFVAGGLLRGSGGPTPQSDIGGLSAPPPASAGYTWHLSVINGGSPRGIQGVKTQWQNISYLTEANWNSVDLTRGVWQISQQNTNEITGQPTTRQVEFGLPGGIPLAGDFNGDGTDELLVYAEGIWFVDMNGNMSWDQDDLWAELGSATDLPVVGDWDGDGKDDIGVYGPQWASDLRAIDLETGLPDLDNDLAGKAKNLPPQKEDAPEETRKLKFKAQGQPRRDVIDHVFRYGTQEELPVTGDWNGDGIRNIGTFREGTWKLDIDSDGRLTSNDETRQFGKAGDLPVVGDFDGDGIEQIAVYRNGTWLIDSNSNGELDATDKVYELGNTGDIPVVGDFDGDGIDETAIYQMKPENSAQNTAPGLRNAG